MTPPPSILLNLLPIAAGGGLQNGLSLVRELADQPAARGSILAIVRGPSRLKDACGAGGLPHVSVPNGLGPRLAFEWRCRSLLPRAAPCFTLFGPPLLRAPGHLLNINGFAYSNLLHPEVQFWSFLQGNARRRKDAIDACRRWAMGRADFWIFETPLLQRRAIELARFPPTRTAVVRMAASSLVGPEHVNPDARARYEQALPPGFRFLFLHGAHPNKRQHLLPALARQLRAAGLPDFVFVLTMDPHAPYTRRVVDAFTTAKLGAHVANLGTVPATEVSSVIAATHAMCSFSVLESFTNNFVEAWRMQRPLVVTDADWSRDACGEGALYVNPTDAAATADALRSIATSASRQQALAAAGLRQLSTYPTPGQKSRMYLATIDRACQLGPCPPADRRGLRWPTPARL